MKANDKSLNFLGTGKELIVPFFQRKYVWKKSNWEELLNSFRMERVPFLGSIIFKHQPNDTSICEIIDGQQRLTTITILAKAIFDSLSDDERNDPDNGIRSGIQSFLFYKENASYNFKKSHVKIRHSRLDKQNYDYIIRSGLFEDVEYIDRGLIDNFNLESIGDDETGIETCYMYYRKVLSFLQNEELEFIYNNMFDESHKSIVLIELYEGDVNEQMVFDTINRAGEKLSSADIIKNNLFKIGLEKCSEVGKTEENVCALYDDKWEQVFSSDDYERKLWDKKRVFGNNQRTNLEFLLYCVAAIKWGCGKDKKDIFPDLEKVYSDNTSDYSYRDFEQLVIEICRYATIYKNEIIDFKIALESDDCDIHFRFSDFVSKLLLVLEKFGVQMFYPYVLKRLNESSDWNTDEQLKYDFLVLESFVVRRRLSPKGVNDYRIKCDQIIHGENGINQLINSDFTNADSVIKNSDIKNYIMNIHNNENAKMILFCIELYRANNSKYDIEGFQYFYTLEHIMPKKWKRNWSDVAIVNPDGTDFLEIENAESYRDTFIYSLGNMTLLRSKLNSSVSNANFETKIHGVSPEKPGYDHYASLSLTRNIIDEYNDGNCIWNEKRIFDRTCSLYDEFIKIWPDFNDGDEGNITTFTDSCNTVSCDDPEKMLDEVISGFAFSPDREIVSNDVNEFILFCNNKNRNIYAYKDLLLLSILENGKDGVIKLSDSAKYFFDFYDGRRQNGLIVEGKDSFIVKKYPYTISDLENEILAYPFDRFKRKSYMEYNSDTNEISIVRPIWNQLKKEQINELKNQCKNGMNNHFNKL